MFQWWHVSRRSAFLFCLLPLPYCYLISFPSTHLSLLSVWCLVVGAKREKRCCWWLGSEAPCTPVCLLIHCEGCSAVHSHGWMKAVGISRTAQDSRAAHLPCLCVTPKKNTPPTSHLLPWLHALPMMLVNYRPSGWKKAYDNSDSAAHLLQQSLSIIYEDFSLKINVLWPEEEQ